MFACRTRCGSDPTINRGLRVILAWRLNFHAKQSAEGGDLQDCGKQETSERLRDSETQYSLLRKFVRITSSFLWLVRATEPTASGWLKVRRYAEVPEQDGHLPLLSICMAIVWRLVNSGSERWGESALRLFLMALRAGVWDSKFGLLWKKSSLFGWPAAGERLLPGFFVGATQTPEGMSRR